MRRPVSRSGRAVSLLVLSAAVLAGAVPARAARPAHPFLASDATSFYLPVRADWFGIVSALPERPAAAARPALAREALCVSADVIVIAKLIELGDVEVRFFQVSAEEFARGPRALRRAEPYARVRLARVGCGADVQGR